MSSLRDRRFVLLASGQALNAIGSWCALVALWGFASFRFHAGAADLALLGLAWAVPAVVLGPVAGIPVDRFGPKWVLVVADSLAAVVALTFLLADSYAALVVLGAVEGATKAFGEPAFQALAPRIVPDEQLASANGVLAMASQSAIALGPLLAAGAIAAFGLEGAFVVNAVTYVIGVLVLLPFHVGPAADAVEHPSRTAALVAEVKEGWRVVVTRPALKGLLLLAATVYVTWGAFIVVEPIYVREVLHGSPTLFALLQTSFGIGLVASGIAVTRLGDRMVKWSIVCAAASGSGLAAMLYVGTTNVAVAFGGLLLWGAVTGLLIAPMRTLMQRAAPVEAHGRVFAFDGMVHSIGDLVSLPLVGLAVGAFGVQFAGVAVGAIPFAGGLLMWRAIRRRQAAADPHFLDAVAEAAAA